MRVCCRDPLGLMKPTIWSSILLNQSDRSLSATTKNGARGDKVCKQHHGGLTRTGERIQLGFFGILKYLRCVDIVEVHMSHRPIAKLSLGDFLEGQEPDVRVSVVPDNSHKQSVNLVSAALNQLDKNIPGKAKQSCYAKLRIIFAGLLQN
jgi:hypothetical protein